MCKKEEKKKRGRKNPSLRFSVPSRRDVVDTHACDAAAWTSNRHLPVEEDDPISFVFFFFSPFPIRRAVEAATLASCSHAAAVSLERERERESADAVCYS